MTDFIDKIEKELRRLGCEFAVTPVDGQPKLCKIEGTYQGTATSGLYNADMLANQLEQMPDPDAGDSGCQLVRVALSQVGVAKPH